MPFLAALAPIAAGAATAATATTALGTAAGIAGAVGGAASLVGGLVGGKEDENYGGANLNTETGVSPTLAGNQNQEALNYQKSFVDALGSQGITNQNNVYSQLQGIANGTGPNPAQAMLNQATGANVANQAALMAGQRGASQNVGMIARQAGQQGGALQQQAAGQGATMQANQSLNAIGQMGNLANTQVSQRANAINAYGQQTNAQQQNALNAIAAQNSAAVAARGGAESLNAQAAARNAGALRSTLGAGASAIGQAANVLAQPGAQPAAQAPVANVDFDMGQMGSKPGTMYAAHGGQVDMRTGGHVPGQAKVAGDSIKNDVVDAKLSPKEIVLPRSITMHPNAPEMAAQFVRQQLAKHGSSKQNFAAGGMLNENEGMVAPPPPPVGASGGWDAPAMPAAPAPAAAPAPIMQGGLAVEGGGSLSQNPTDPYALQQQQYEKGYTSQLKGIEAEAAAAGQLGQAQAGIEQRTAQNLQRQMGRYEQEHQKLIGERQKIQQDIQTGKIDPNRYLGSMETSQKFSTAMGLIMGGIGQGLMQSGENPALTFLNKQIDNDIKAQQTNLSSKESLLSANMQQLGDLQAATQMTKVTMLDMAAAEMRAAAAKAQNPMAKARALQAAGQLEAQAAPIMSQMALKRSLMGGGPGGGGGYAMDPSKKIRLMGQSGIMTEGQQKEALSELKEAQGLVRARENTLDAFEKIDEMKSLWKQTSEPWDADSRIKALRDPIVAKLSKETAGRFTEQDAKMLETLFPHTKDDPETIATKRQKLKDLIDEKMNFPALKQWDIGGDYGAETKESKLTPEQKTYLEWARKNPSNRVSQQFFKKYGVR